ncbi:MAG TPA: CDP-alcohol phosphatidyltransferase family protein, partial [Candidatus Tectomicrobia bacterium]|nr:CDP-alcohol phosphatidyltransferase family protein [Candidatus Tectomicrobia bacterium]
AVVTRTPPGPDRWCARVADPAAAAAAEARLYAALGSPIDTWLDVAFHRRLSRPVSRWAVARGVTPNQVTVASGVVGLVAAVVLAAGELLAAVAGVALYAAAVVLDHADGEVARLTLTESAMGEWLDIAVDTVVHAALVVALGVAATRVAGGGMGLGLLAAAGVVLSAILWKLVPPAYEADGLGRLVERLSSRDAFYAMLLIFVAIRVVAPGGLPAFMAVIALGGNAYWPGRLAYLAVRRARLSR